MRARAWLCSVGMAGAMLAAGGLLTACGGGADAKFAIGAKAGDMPEGQTWTGVYFNPVYGYLHMSEEGGNVTGRWKRANGSAWGELSGTVEGNVVHYTWKEHQYGAVGPSGNSKGTGVFVYKMGEAAPELDGQYSLEASDSVGQWHCVKQNNMKVDIGSINGDNPESAAPTQDAWH